MKRVLFVSVMVLMAAPLFGQKLVIGERSPEVKVSRWLTAEPSAADKAMLVEFFHSSNSKSIARLETLNALARELKDELVVIVITKEQSDIARKILLASGAAYYAAVDSGGKTFSAYGAQYIPYSVLSDRRGRVKWLGNPSSLLYDDIIKMIR